MNYDKLVNRLRRKAYNYEGKQEIKFSRILKEAIKRKLNSKEFKRAEAIRTRISDEALLFITD
tara:strand:- start:4506 stop:4694 length:189 start_codon:yes stop_codon:yes gene_type:complete